MNIASWRKLCDLVAKYSPQGENEWLVGGAAHDVIFINLPEPDEIGPEDLEELDSLNIAWDDSFDTWVKNT
jgi:hypothetical protein